MEKRELGTLGVSVIGLGTLRAFDVTEESDLVTRRQIIENCISAKINFIDSAAAYGAAEKAVGIATEGIRDKFYLATKVRIEGKEAGERQILQSFENFNTGYIDLLQIHNMIDYQTHLPTLERLQDEGKIGMIGVTAMVVEAYPAIMDLMRFGRIDTCRSPTTWSSVRLKRNCCPWPRNWAPASWSWNPSRRADSSKNSRENRT